MVRFGSVAGAEALNIAQQNVKPRIGRKEITRTSARLFAGRVNYLVFSAEHMECADCRMSRSPPCTHWLERELWLLDLALELCWSLFEPWWVNILSLLVRRSIFSGSFALEHGASCKASIHRIESGGIWSFRDKTEGYCPPNTAIPMTALRWLWNQLQYPSWI